MTAEETKDGRVMYNRATDERFTLFLEASHNGARVSKQPSYVHPNCEGCGTKRHLGEQS